MFIQHLNLNSNLNSKIIEIESVIYSYFYIKYQIYKYILKLFIPSIIIQ